MMYGSLTHGSMRCDELATNESRRGRIGSWEDDARQAEWGCCRAE